MELVDSRMKSDPALPRRLARRRTPFNVISELYLDFCTNTNIHGFRYLSQRRPAIERAIWYVFVLIAITGATVMIHKLWYKWRSSPILVSFDEKLTPITEIPFPAITICPEMKSDAQLFNFTAVFHSIRESNHTFENLNETVIMNYLALSQICDPHLAETLPMNQKHEDVNLIRTLESLAVKDFIVQVEWEGRRYQVNQLFNKLWTNEGLCFSFNLFDTKDLFNQNQLQSDYAYVHDLGVNKTWTLSSGYSNPDDGSDVYPRRARNAGSRNSLRLLLKANEKNFDYVCKGPVQGYKIVMHGPNEIPELSDTYFRIPLNQEVLIAIKPNVMTTATNLIEYSSEVRQCYFHWERKLRYFRIYTQNNCELECLSNFTYYSCGCVKFSMPRDKDIPICGSSMISCYNNAQDKLLKLSMVEGIDNRFTCNCLPACSSIGYDGEISQANFEWRKFFIAHKKSMDNLDGYHLSRIIIYFKEKQFITSKRNELYGVTDFVANCGGLLGLFMSISLLSLIEILYYCTIRLGWNLRAARYNVSYDGVVNNTDENDRATGDGRAQPNGEIKVEKFVVLSPN